MTGVATVARDLTERNRAEASQRALEDRVHQAERLETVGQLAGGIAHDPMPGLPPVLADGGQLEQVLLSLAVNARDAMPAGGVVTFRTGAVDLGEGDSRLGQGVSPGCFVEIAVSDTGTSMSAEVASRAWEPFFTTKELARGTGLGLSTVYGIVRAAGGTVSIDTAEGGGTTFRLYFPHS